VNENKTKRGGTRPGSGRPKGTTYKTKGLPTAQMVSIRMYPQDLERAQNLVKLGYGNDKSDVIRKALQEALERFMPAA
jgi:hypothetical protein